MFRSGPDSRTETYDVSNDVWTVVARRNVWGRFDSPDVMLPPNPNRFLCMGGYDNTNQPNNTAEIIDLSSPNPQWTYIAPMNFVRMEFNVAILPDAKIFVVGGRSDFLVTVTWVYVPEIFDPEILARR